MVRGGGSIMITIGIVTGAGIGTGIMTGGAAEVTTSGVSVVSGVGQDGL